MEFMDKYKLTNYERDMYKVLERKRAYEALYNSIEAGCHDDFEPTAEEVENILDAFIRRRHDDIAAEKEGLDLDDAVLYVREKEYTLEVHAVFYDTVTVFACDEKEAHELARQRYQGSVVGKDNFIRVIACGTNKVDGEEVDNEYDEHTTEWD